MTKRRTRGGAREPQHARRPVAVADAPSTDGPKRSRLRSFFGGLFRMVRRALGHLVFPVLAAAVVTVVLLIGMFPARAYLEQKDAIADAQSRLTQLADDNKKAEDELGRLTTDAEIEKVARQQIGLVKPGEEVYHVMPAPQDPIAVPDAWPFDGMRKRMGAQVPATPDAAGGPTTSTTQPGTPPTSAAPAKR